MKTTLFLAGFVSLSLAFLSPTRGQTTAPATTTPAAAAEPIFGPMPILDISGKHDFADVSNVNDDVAAQLKGMCSLAEFRALPEVDRHVYAFDPWPSDKDDLEKKTAAFHFKLGTEGVTSQKIAFTPGGGGAGKTKTIYRGKNAATGASVLQGFGNLDWSGVTTHVFKFDKPVTAFGVAFQSTGDVELRRFFWKSNSDNGYPVSYTLADGTIIQLGEREIRGALIKADTSTFIGVIDRSGTGIVSVSYAIRGLAGNKAQGMTINGLAFATMPKPAVAAVINLKSSCDFYSPETIAAAPSPALPGLTTLDAFRFIVGNHRYVYHFDTWPTKSPDLGASGEFPFDLKGKGTAGQKVTVTANNAGQAAKLAQVSLTNADKLPYPALGMGDLKKGVASEQTFKFENPVWTAGVTYRSPGDVTLADVTYTLSDGKVISAGPSGDGCTLAANGKTFVGVRDDTDKGIVSITFRVQGTADSPQPLYIEDLAFAMAGPPPGEWKLTLADEFDGDTLNPKIWSTGYRFVDVINNELQGFVPENVTVANGLCTIKVEKRDVKNTDWKGNTKANQKFASGAFTSAGRFTQTYGYFEARLKMPKARGAGVWPAFWVLPDRGSDYPDNIRYGYMSNQYGRGMEIDIFEFMPRWKRLDGTFPIHVGCIWSYGKVTEKDPAPHGYGAYALENDGWGPKELNFPELDTKFHTYGLYWSPERLIWYLDSKPIFRVRDAKKMPDVPHYFLFNVSLHLNGWGKSPDKSHPKMEEVIADLPNAMEIDYFRAYTGTLEEPLPTSPTDVPVVVTKYSPPPKEVAEPKPVVATPSTQPTTQAGHDVPAAPVNSQITTPAN